MVYQITGQSPIKTAIINGSNGTYGQANGTDFKNSSIFGRNSISNFNEYNAKELGKPVDANNPAALNYEVQYSPVADPNSDTFKTALMASADEDLGGKPISVKKTTEDYQKLLGKNANTEALDLNGDGNIDQAENAAYTLLQDACDNQDPNNPQIDSKNIDGKFTKSGHDNSMFVFAKNNVDNNKNLLKQIYDKYNLGDVMYKLTGNNTAQSAQDNATTSNPAASKAEDSSPATLKVNNQTLGEIVLQNKKMLSEKYGTKKLWGDGGLVDQLAKANGYEGFQDKKLNNLKIGQDYNFNISKPEK
jgi:hypothetical protein